MKTSHRIIIGTATSGAHGPYALYATRGKFLGPR